MILQSFPRETTRIELLRTAISALSLYDPDDYNYNEAANIRKGIRIIARSDDSRILTPYQRQFTVNRAFRIAFTCR